MWLLASRDASPPRFEDYPAESIYKGTPAPPILVTPEQRLYRTRIRNGVNNGEGVERPHGEVDHAGPNFAGHYIIVEIGCGSPCTLMAIVDAMTGRIYNPPMSNGLQLPRLDGGPWLPTVEFRMNSSLMIMRPCPNLAKGPVLDHYFLWQNNQWRLIRRIPQPRISGTPER